MSSGARPIGGSATGETGVGLLRNAESGRNCTPGYFGSQGATGEGVWVPAADSAAPPRAAGLEHGGATFKRPRDHPRLKTAVVVRFRNAPAQQSFSCCCGQPMNKSTSRGPEPFRASLKICQKEKKGGAGNFVGPPFYLSSPADLWQPVKVNSRPVTPAGFSIPQFNTLNYPPISRRSIGRVRPPFGLSDDGQNLLEPLPKCTTTRSKSMAPPLTRS